MIQQTEPTPQTVLPTLTETFPGFKTILVATDFSSTSDRALEYALSFARSYGSRLYLAHVMPIDLMMAPELSQASREKLRDAAEGGFKKMLRTQRFFGVPYETILEEGSLWPTLKALIEKKGIDLVVVGTHGAGSAQKVVMGSAAEEIFRQANVPVLTVGPAAREPLYDAELKNILFATDFGPSAAKQAAYAFSVAEQHRSRLTLLHVLRKGSWEEAESGPEVAIVKLRQLLPSNELHCLPLFRVPLGRPVEEILSAARSIQADLIVLGAKSRNGLAGHIPHTKAYEIVCGATCPVLTLKSYRAATRTSEALASATKSRGMARACFRRRDGASVKPPERGGKERWLSSCPGSFRQNSF